MASDKKFVEFILDQIQSAGQVQAKPMFGDYGVYCNKKIVGLICDDQLYLKPTESGKMFIGDIIEAPPYPGAKNYFLIEDKFEDREWISELIKITADALPLQKKKKRKPDKTTKIGKTKDAIQPKKGSLRSPR
jgi:TfoX/Sxy family transcriptional regulator of competence genes